MKKLILISICFFLFTSIKPSMAFDLEAFRADLDKCLEEASERADKELGVDKYLMEMERIKKMEIDGLFHSDRFMVERIRLRSEAIRKLVDGELAESMKSWGK